MNTISTEYTMSTIAVLLSNTVLFANMAMCFERKITVFGECVKHYIEKMKCVLIFLLNKM